MKQFYVSAMIYVAHSQMLSWQYFIKILLAKIINIYVPHKKKDERKEKSCCQIVKKLNNLEQEVKLILEVLS